VIVFAAAPPAVKVHKGEHVELTLILKELDPTLQA
jgi:hypothetical protein